MIRKVVVVGVLSGAALWVAASVVDAAVLCQKKTGAIFVRASACKPKETQVDPTSLLGTLPARVTALESLPTRVMAVEDATAALEANALTKTSTAAVAGYATVASNGTLVESYSSNGGTVTSSRAQLGAYSVFFGFQIRPNQPMIAVPRETFAANMCRVFQGASSQQSVSVFCGDTSSTAVDVAFTLVVFR
jgi:hypothetical protein